MSFRKIRSFKLIPSYISNSLKEPFGALWRRYATNSRVKSPLPGAFLERQPQSLVARATLSARSPFVHDRVFPAEKLEERTLPQHEPGHLVLMPPLRPAKQLSLVHQQNMLNGNRQPAYSEVDSDPEDCVSALERVRRMEESRKVHKKMLDLMQQQRELNQSLQDRYDEKRGDGGVGGALKQGLSRWASRAEEERLREQAVSAERPAVATARAETGTPPGSRDSATALVAAEVHSKPSMYNQRLLQAPTRLPTGEGYRTDRDLYRLHMQKPYHPRNMTWPDYSASTSQSYKSAVTTNVKPIYSARPDSSDDYDSDSDDTDTDFDYDKSKGSVRPDNKDPKHSINMANRQAQAIVELHKDRASEMEKRAIKGLSKKSATKLVIEQKEPSRGKVVIKSYRPK